MLCDLSSASTLSDAEFWYSEIKDHTNEIPLILVGTKSDLFAEISEDVFSQFANRKDLPYIVTSAKENRNVEEAFVSLVNLAVVQQKNFLGEGKEQGFHLNYANKKKECCLNF